MEKEVSAPQPGTLGNNQCPVCGRWQGTGHEAECRMWLAQKLASSLGGVMSGRKVKFYLSLAEAAALQGTCPRAQVGAIIINKDRVVSLGYNGSPRGTPHCEQAGCWMVEVEGVEHCLRSVHAETNAILNAAFGGAQTAGAVMVCTHRPCLRCYQAIINAGIEQVFFAKHYGDTGTDNLAAVSAVRLTEV